jgi:PAS domain S-box-containing protein
MREDGNSRDRPVTGGVERSSTPVGAPVRDGGLAADLAGMRRLCELQTRLSGETDLHAALEEILAAACELTDTERGCVQLLSEDGKRLEMTACRGFPNDSAFVDHVRHFGSHSDFDLSTRRHLERLVIEDVAASAFLSGTEMRDLALAEDVRAIQATLLISRRGEMVGVLSTLFSEPHRPTDEELGQLDLLAWTAVDFVARHQADEALRRSAELAAFRVRLADALRPLFDPVEVQATASRMLGEYIGADRVFYGELTADDEHVVVARDHSPGLAGIAGRYRLSDFGPGLVARNRAGHTVVATDVAADPTLTEAEKATYLAISVGAHVDVPLIKGGRFAAFFAAQQAVPRNWTPVEVHLIEEVAERTWSAVERARAEEALRSSEQRYRHLFESIDEGFCIIEMIYDDDGRPADYRFLEANPSFVGQTGLQNAVGRTMREMVPRHEEHWFEIYGRIAMTGEPSRFTNEAKAMGRWYDVYAFRVGEPRERRVGVLFNDVTDRKRVEANLSFLAEVSESLMGLTGIEETMNVLGAEIGEYFGASACSFSEIDETKGTFTVPYAWHRGGVRNQLGEHSIGDYYTADFVRLAHTGVTGVVRDTSNDSRTNTANMAAIQVGALITVPLVRDGAWRFSLTITDTRPRDWRDDEIQLLGELATRIWTRMERARAEDGLRESEAQLREADRRKNEFLAVLAHELRNPLAPIRTGLELLRVTDNATDAVESLRVMMERQIGHMVRLIDDLLDVSRITSGKIRLQRELTPIARLLTSAIEANRDAITAKQLTLSLRLPDTLCIVDADPTRFAQVLSNLLHNAAKFTEPGGSIRVSAVVEPPDASGAQHLIVSVADSGIGIAPKLLPRIFELFTQGDRGSTQPGLGIGLALARQLVELHGGQIDVRSEGTGHGSEFLIRLPLPPQVLPQQPADAGAPLRIDCRVVVIDDNRDAADTLTKLVEVLGGECRTAYDGETGLREVLAHRPEVVLLDIGMPGMDGYETCRRIRLELGTESFLVAVTGFGQEHDKDRATRAGFDAHLTKPADPTALESILASVCARPATVP